MSIARNTGYNLLGIALPVLVTLVTLPLYIKAVGLERYGVLSVCWMLLMYFAMFDLGLGRAVTQRIAGLADAPAKARSDVFWTGFWISAAMMVVAMAVMVPVARYALGNVKFDTPAIGAEIGAAVPWLALCVPVSLLTGLFNGALTGRERFALYNAVDVTANSLAAIVPLVVAWLIGPTLWMLLAASLLVRIVAALALFLACRRAVPLARPTGIDRDIARSLAAYGGWVSVTGLVGPLLAFCDRLAIGWVLGAVAVSIYNIPMLLALRIVALPSAFARALFPRFAALDPAAAEKLHHESLKALSVLMTPAILGAILLARPFLILWIGQDVAIQSAPILAILLPSIWFNAMAQIAFTLLQAGGRPRTVAWIMLAELLPYGLLLFGGMHYMGLLGAALAWSVRNVVDTLLLVHFAGRDGLRALLPVAPAGAIVVIAAVFAVALPASGIAYWAILSLLTIVGAWIAYRTHPDIVHGPIGAVLGRLRRTVASTDNR